MSQKAKPDSLKRSILKWSHLSSTEKGGSVPSREAARLYAMHLVKLDAWKSLGAVSAVLNRLYLEPIQMQFEFMEQNNEKRLQK